MLDGQLFASDFLHETIREFEAWRDLADDDLAAFTTSLTRVFKAFPTDQSPNEATTESELIWPILTSLGWADTLTQQNLSSTGRQEVPDGLLFLDSEAKARALEHSADFRRYAYGACIMEAKRWDRPLDRSSRQAGDDGMPSGQILRYLSRADLQSDRKLKWGILTNGRLWRLYWQDARSRANEFFEVDLFDAVTTADTHALKVFLLLFGRDAFEKTDTDQRTRHDRALEEARLYEARVKNTLSDQIFNHVFPALATAIADRSPETELTDVRDAALVLLYRLLFILYAEDRNLLPAYDDRYDDYGLRMKVRDDVGRRLDEGDAFAEHFDTYWNQFSNLCRAIDMGERSIGVPPYNGGLFNTEGHPLLNDISLPDAVMAPLIDAMCFEKTVDGRRKYINYRDLSVQQLGSVYERLLEFDVVRDDGQVRLRPNIFARKGSGSYYTPQDLVELIVSETVGPLIERAKTDFDDGGVDPADAILNLKVCDPAMGSGHFLVHLVDYLSDAVMEAIEQFSSESYIPPIVDRIEKIRTQIMHNARRKDWTIRDEHLDDRNLIRRMVLKRCIFGVDKNPMAVELAKVSLWLHTFTVGAPLSFLDHHLKCGDSLFGMDVKGWKYRVADYGGGLLVSELVGEAEQAENLASVIESIPDTEIDEVEESKSIFKRVEVLTRPLLRYMSFVHAIEWLKLSKSEIGLVKNFFNDQFGDSKSILNGYRPPKVNVRNGEAFQEIWKAAMQLVEEENFFHWQVGFPTVWHNWSAPIVEGGFDAVIGNPPWDRMKLQQVEWFATRDREIAGMARASDRKKAIKALEADDPLKIGFDIADSRAKQALAIARLDEKKGGNYPWLGRGDINLYSLFVERAQQLIKQDGFFGLLVPSGIASDKTAAPFFRDVATKGRLKALYDFENKKIFFPDVHASFKFCAFIASGTETSQAAKCAFYMHSVDTIQDENRCFPLSATDFARINPNTGTAPIFRTRRDAELTRQIYETLPVLIDHSGTETVKTWPVKYTTMFHMTNDSHLFRTQAELERDEKAWPIGGNRWESASGEWVPLYEGKMVQAYDHRAADIVINSSNLNRPAQPIPATLEQHIDPDWQPRPQFFIQSVESPEPDRKYMLGFKDVTAPTNMRTMIASIVPSNTIGNTFPVLLFDLTESLPKQCVLLGNLNAIPYDFLSRQKVQGQHLNWYIVEQLPVVPPEMYDRAFGPKTAGEIVREAVLELTYTAHDMAPFAKDMGYVDASGAVKPPFPWDEDRRLFLKAKLDALYFILYGITDPEDVDYIYSTFPIVQRHEERDHGEYKTKRLAKHWINALLSGRPDASISP